MEALVKDLIAVEDATIETFELFAELRQDGVDLGMLDPSKPTVNVTVQAIDFEITQSPGLLRSNHAGGTTGAALWRAGIHCAKWLADPSNILFQTGILHLGATTLELGAGIAALSSCILAHKLGENGQRIATDMHQSLKLLRENIAVNTAVSKAKGVDMKRKHGKSSSQASQSLVEVHPLDWEEDDAQAFLKTIGLGNGVDVVIACDCVYNYALIEPLMQTCAAISQLRHSASADRAMIQTLSIFVQQLRQPDIMQEWLETTLKLFDVWRVPAATVGETDGGHDGFVIHLFRLKST